MSLIEKLFSIKDEKKYKIINFLGIKFSFKKKSQSPYEENFEHQSIYTYSSAKDVIYIFTNYYKPNSVVDVGCGAGAWLKAWYDFDNSIEIKGYDLYSSKSQMLLIDKKCVEEINLDSFIIKNNKKYDLAMSLEVGEHIKNENSEKFVKDIINLSDMILFSAAIPYQPGTEHINCQPLNFWVKIFNDNGYNCFDFIRSKVMTNEKVEWWYSQNILVFARGEAENILTQKGLIIDNNPVMYYHPACVKMLINR